MTLVQSRLPQYPSSTPGFSSCTSQANIYRQVSPSPSPKTSIGGLSAAGRLRRSSNASLSSTTSAARPRCLAQIRQIEVDIASIALSPCVLRVQTPTGEAADLRFDPGSSHSFVPTVDGCGHGTWYFEVFELINDGLHSDHMVSRHSRKMSLHGVGSLYFAVTQHFEFELQSQEFLCLPASSICSH